MATKALVGTRYIPIYLIVNGCFAIVRTIFTICLWIGNHLKNDGDKSLGRNPVSVIFTCFLAWFIAGNVWVFRISGQTTTSDPMVETFCHPQVSLFAFGVTISAYCIVGLTFLGIFVYDEMKRIDLKINVTKSQVMRIGNRRQYQCNTIKINGTEVDFTLRMKYLGLYIESSKTFKVFHHEARVKFYRSFNTLYSRSHRCTEPVMMQLMNSYCKPVLLYGFEAVNLKGSQISSLDYTFNSAVGRIFGVELKNVELMLTFTGEFSIHVKQTYLLPA